jgi:hypothetical protein
MIARATTPPATPPAIAAVFDFFPEDEEGTTEEEVVGAPPMPVAVEEIVLPPTPLAETVVAVEGVIDTPASTSGRSPTVCAVVSFQRFTLVISTRAHCGTRVPEGMGFGNVEAASVFVQLAEYWDQVIHVCPWHPSQALKRL